MFVIGSNVATAAAAVSVVSIVHVGANDFNDEIERLKVGWIGEEGR